MKRCVRVLLAHIRWTEHRVAMTVALPASPESWWLQSREHVVEGIGTFPETLLMLFDGRNEGKLVIEV